MFQIGDVMTVLSVSLKTQIFILRYNIVLNLTNVIDVKACACQDIDLVNNTKTTEQF